MSSKWEIEYTTTLPNTLKRVLRVGYLHLLLGIAFTTRKLEDSVLWFSPGKF